MFRRLLNRKKYAKIFLKIINVPCKEWGVICAANGRSGGISIATESDHFIEGKGYNVKDFLVYFGAVYSTHRNCGLG